MGNTLQIAVANGSIVRAYPPTIAVGNDGSADLSVTGGLAYVPFTLPDYPDIKGID